MNTFQRNFVFAISVLLAAGAITTGSLTAYSIYKESKARAEQALIRKRVDRVRGMNLCAELTGDERARLDAQANDPDGTKRVLYEIHVARFNFWRNKSEGLLEIYTNYINRFGMDQDSKKISDKHDESIETASSFAKRAVEIREHDVNAPFEDPKEAALKGKAGFK